MEVGWPFLCVSEEDQGGAGGRTSTAVSYEFDIKFNIQYYSGCVPMSAFVNRLY